MLLALLTLAGTLGGPVLLIAVLVLLGLVAVLSRAGTRSHVSHWLMVASIGFGLGSASFVWWVVGVRLDAGDAMTSEPAAAAWGGTALVIFVLSVVTLCACAVIAVTRERHVRQ